MVAIGIMALLVTNSLSTNPVWILLSLLIAAALAFFHYSNVQRLKQRAAAHDHFVEAGREFKALDHCVNCCRPHASASFRVMPRIYGRGPLIPLIDSRFRHPYFFRYCPACARPIRRRRLAGTIILAFVFAILGVWMIDILLMIAFPEGHAPDGVQMIAVLGLLVGTFVCLPLAMAGQLLHRSAPGVWILDNGEPKVIIHFTNQVYRNHFVEFNGGEGPAQT